MALSIDLRERIIEAIEEKNLSKTDVIRIFNINRTGLDYLLSHYKETGSLNPKPHGGGRPSKFNDDDIEKIQKFIEKKPDATLEEILEHTGKDASLTSLFRTLNKTGYKLKKSHYSQVSENEKMLRRREPNGKK